MRKQNAKEPFSRPVLKVYGSVAELTGTIISSAGNINEPIGNDSGTIQGRKKTG